MSEPVLNYAIIALSTGGTIYMILAGYAELVKAWGRH